MVKIPPEVVEAAGEAFLQKDCAPSYSFDDCIRAAIAAGLNAWPNAKTLRDDGRRQTYIVPALILPLPQEVRDE